MLLPMYNKIQNNIPNNTCTICKSLMLPQVVMLNHNNVINIIIYRF